MWNLDEHLCLETMNFQLISPNEAYLGVGEPGTNFCSLVTLKLQHIAIFWMFNYMSIASKFLSESFENCLMFGLEALNSSQSFTAVSLLNSNVYETILNRATSVVTDGGIGERIMEPNLNKTGRTRRVGLVLSGCGEWDGTEIHETVLTLLALDRVGATIVCAAPDMDQLHVLNHLNHEEMDETRNAMVESARLARGDVIDLKKLSAGNLDALILPGGHGAIKQLSQFAVKGPQANIHAHLQRLMVRCPARKNPSAQSPRLPSPWSKRFIGLVRVLPSAKIQA